MVFEKKSYLLFHSSNIRFHGNRRTKKTHQRKTQQQKLTHLLVGCFHYQFCFHGNRCQTRAHKVMRFKCCLKNKAKLTCWLLVGLLICSFMGKQNWLLLENILSTEPDLCDYIGANSCHVLRQIYHWISDDGAEQEKLVIAFKCELTEAEFWAWWTLARSNKGLLMLIIVLHHKLWIVYKRKMIMAFSIWLKTYPTVPSYAGLGSWLGVLCNSGTESWCHKQLPTKHFMGGHFGYAASRGRSASQMLPDLSHLPEHIRKQWGLEGKKREGGRVGRTRQEVVGGVDQGAIVHARSYPLILQPPATFLSLDLHQLQRWQRSEETHCGVGCLWELQSTQM